MPHARGENKGITPPATVSATAYLRGPVGFLLQSYDSTGGGVGAVGDSSMILDLSPFSKIKPISLAKC